MKSIIDTIGNTPVFALKNIQLREGIQVYGKFEGMNPGGSVKDRPALYMTEQAEKRGDLCQGKTILEASSGNMGISLAMIGAVKTYPVTIVMSEGMSMERRKIMQSLGADIILTDPALGTQGAIEKARILAQDNPDKYWFVNQFSNPDNLKAHYHGLGRELVQAFPDVDAVIGGTGTSGTLMGTAIQFSESGLNTKFIAAIPPVSYVIQGIQNPYKDFMPGVYDVALLNQEVDVTADEAAYWCKMLAFKEGLFTGMSSGAAMAATAKVAKSRNEGKLLVILPDRGERYLSMGIY
jgi:cysteine synthase